MSTNVHIVNNVTKVIKTGRTQGLPLANQHIVQNISQDENGNLTYNGMPLMFMHVGVEPPEDPHENMLWLDIS